MKKCKLLLFDLDGTLLQSDKTISKRTLAGLKRCKEKGILIGVSTRNRRQGKNCGQKSFERSAQLQSVQAD